MNSPKRLLIRQQIQDQFDRAANTYDSVSELQRRMGQSLQQLIVESGSNPEDSLIDLGCGTGELLLGLEQAGLSNLTGLDLSAQMLEVAKTKTSSASFVHADIESIPCDDGAFKLAVSNAALQWCDIGMAAKEIFRTLEPGGKAWLTSFTEGTLGQWHRAFTTLGFKSRVHVLPGATEIRCQFEQAGFKVVNVELLAETVQFDSVENMFGSIKRLGASNAMESRSRMNRAEYQATKQLFQNELETQGQLGLDYVWVQMSVEKPLT